MGKRVILSAGGTGGHLFPAQVVAERLEELGCEVLFAAGGLTTSRFFHREKFRFEEIKAAPLSLHPLRFLKGASTMTRGVVQGRKLLSSFHPDLVVGFGSFFAFPLLAAACMKRVPFLLHEQNSIPGKVNRLLSRWARATAITFPQSASYLKGESVLTAFPLRFEKSAVDKKASLEYFGLTSSQKTLLVLGGSQGAAALNALVKRSAVMLKQQGVQLLHFIGAKESREEYERYYECVGLAACVKEFESKMDCAFAAADCALARGGASTVAELISWEMPALLVPFPHAADNHQEGNAAHFVTAVKGGEMCLQNRLTVPLLEEALLSLEKGAYKDNIRSYKAQKKCRKFEELIVEWM